MSEIPGDWKSRASRLCRETLIMRAGLAIQTKPARQGFQAVRAGGESSPCSLFHSFRIWRSAIFEALAGTPAERDLLPRGDADANDVSEAIFDEGASGASPEGTLFV